MAQNDVPPNSARKRKLPSFMAAKQTEGKSEGNQPVKPTTKQTPAKEIRGISQAADRKPLRQSKLPLKRAAHPKTNKASEEKANKLTSDQQAVLAISDAALVNECQSILQQANASAEPAMQAASTANRATTSADTDSATTSATAASNRDSASIDLAEAVHSSAVPVDIMDMETQVLDVLPMFRANAAAMPAVQSQHDSLHQPPPLSASQLHEQHYKHDKAESLSEGTAHASLSVQDQQNKSLISAAEASHARDQSTSTLGTAVKAAADTSKAPSGMDSLLDAMLAGDL